jgi:hypothetical protein
MAKILKLKEIKVKIHSKNDEHINDMKVRFRSQYPAKINQIDQLTNWDDCLRFRMENQDSGVVPKHGYREFIVAKNKTTFPSWTEDLKKKAQSPKPKL